MTKYIVRIHKFLLNRSYILIITILIFTAITLVLTLLPVQHALPSDVLSHDKLGHMFLFGGWTFLIGYYRYISKPESTNLIVILLLGIFFGGCIEGLQGIMPFHRDPSIYDLGADALGGLVATLALYKIIDILPE